MRTFSAHSTWYDSSDEFGPLLSASGRSGLDLRIRGLCRAYRDGPSPEIYHTVFAHLPERAFLRKLPANASGTWPDKPF